MSRTAAIGVGTFVIKENRILLGYRGPQCRMGRGCWSLPGGMCEPGEHALDAALRETHEECDLVIKKPEIFFASDWLPKHNIVTIWTVGWWTHGQPKPTEEGKMQNWRWCDFDTVRDLCFAPVGVVNEQSDWVPQPIFTHFFKKYILEPE